MLKKRFIFAVVSLFTVGVAANTQAVSGRDYISIVGSSTVYPFATTVAEQFGKITRFKTPKIESTGSGGGMKLFCAGSGIETPDISNASRRIKASEYEKCQNNGVKEIIEVKIGYDGIVLANSKKVGQMTLSKKDIFLGLAKDVPNPNGDKILVANPYKTWKEVCDRLNQPGTGLSGGQQQRLCIARAIAVRPEVILMDEPCSALDPIATATVENLIAELQEQYTIVIVTHNMQQAARVSQRTAYFHLGDLIEVGSTDRVFTNPRHKLTEDYITGRFG